MHLFDFKLVTPVPLPLDDLEGRRAMKDPGLLVVVPAADDRVA